jgi:hypothetical protein
MKSSGFSVLLIFSSSNFAYVFFKFALRPLGGSFVIFTPGGKEKIRIEKERKGKK